MIQFTWFPLDLSLTYAIILKILLNLKNVHSHTIDIFALEDTESVKFSISI